MSTGARGQVVILYEHPLLGEGIARHVLAQCGVQPTIAPVSDHKAVRTALERQPSIVIFELSTALPQGDLATLAPGAVLIDVTGAVNRGAAVAPGLAGLENILQVVREVTGAVPKPAS
jgi:hypothetical protein